MSAGGASGGQGVPATPPTPLPSHAMAPLPSHAMPPPTAAAGNALLNAAREQERVYMELLSRPPYNSDPILAQQVWLHTIIVNVTEALVLRPLLEDRGCITESIRILVPVDRMKQKCFQITTKRVHRSQQFQLRW